MLIPNTNQPPPLPPLYPGCFVGVRCVPEIVATLEKCHGSHSKDRRDKYNDKYTGKDKKTDKNKNVRE